MMAGDEISFVTSFPHRAHSLMGSSLMLCFTSKRWAQLVHWYSYIGTGHSSSHHRASRAVPGSTCPDPLLPLV